MRSNLLPRLSAVIVALAASVAIAPTAAQAHNGPSVPKLVWSDCDDGFQCATATVPLDYSRPNKATYDIALIKKPASGAADQRIGSLFINPGGPGGDGT